MRSVRRRWQRLKARHGWGRRCYLVRLAGVDSSQPVWRASSWAYAGLPYYGPFASERDAIWFAWWRTTLGFNMKIYTVQMRYPKELAHGR